MWNPFSRTKPGSSADAPAINEDQDELFTTSGLSGVQVLYDPGDAIIDIVFVHGLTGNRLTTWSHSDGVCWPRDLLAKDCPKARILTWGYDADVIRFGLKVAGSNNLRDHGKNLATDIGIWRKDNYRSKTRRVVFVAHSLGGLVVEQAMIISRGAATPYLEAVLTDTHGVIFMGAPHGGADLANWGSFLTKLSSILNRTNQEIVAVLKPASEMLANVQQEFHTMLTQRRNKGKREMEIYCFYEGEPIRGVGKIVPDHSAVLTSYENAALPGTHTSMTKFSDAADPGYVRVLGQIKLMVEGAQNQSTVSHKQSENDRGNQPRRKQKTVTYSGNVYTEGGHNHQGDNNAGGDIVMSNRR